MNPKVQITTEYLNSLSPLTFMDDDKIKERFISTYKAMHKGCTDADAEDFYYAEAMHFKRIMNASNDFQACTMFSLYACFIDIIILDLSFDPQADLVYVLFDNFNAAPKNQTAAWEKRARNDISPYGELAMRIQQGQLRYADDPVIVYSCDEWEPGYREDGTRYSIYKAKVPRPADASIIGSFIKLTRADGSFDMPWFTEENIAEWKQASANKNKNTGANKLYGDDNKNISIGFLKAKTIKHSFKALPKLKINGANISIEDNNLEVSNEGQLVEKTPAAPITAAARPPANQKPAEPMLQPKPAAAIPPPPPPFSFVAQAEEQPTNGFVVNDPDCPF